MNYAGTGRCPWQSCLGWAHHVTVRSFRWLKAQSVNTTQCDRRWIDSHHHECFCSLPRKARNRKRVAVSLCRIPGATKPERRINHGEIACNISLHDELMEIKVEETCVLQVCSQIICCVREENGSCTRGEFVVREGV